MSFKPVDKSKIYLVTGAAGFIGYYISRRLLEQGCQVIGIDNLNDYYEIELKLSRLELLEPFQLFTFIRGDISKKEMIDHLFAKYRPHIVLNLAAQAGVRYSLEHPDPYIVSNIIGFFNLLEACRAHPVEHLLYASSSSVYGSSKKIPFKESDPADRPASIYAATKRANELMAYTYSYLYKIPATGLRFFTVYGPMGRPDMAYFKFTKSCFAGEPIRIYNNGDFENDLYRDFTYIDDVVFAMESLLNNPPAGEVPHKLYNIGNNKPVKLMQFIETLESCLSRATGRKVLFEKIFEPVKPGDIPVTYASTDLLEKTIGFRPMTTLEEGLQRFADWYVEYYRVK